MKAIIPTIILATVLYVHHRHYPTDNSQFTGFCGSMSIKQCVRYFWPPSEYPMPRFYAPERR